MAIFRSCDVGQKGYVTFRDFHQNVINAGGAKAALEFENGADRLRNKVLSLVYTPEGGFTGP